MAIKKILLSILLCIFSMNLLAATNEPIKPKTYQQINKEVTDNLIKMFSVKTNMFSLGWTEKSLYATVADICSKYYWININTPMMYIDPQVITIKDGKIELSKIQKLTIAWKHPYNDGLLLMLNADVVPDLRGNDKVKSKVFNGLSFFGGINAFNGGDDIKNYSCIGVGMSLFSLFGINLDVSVLYNSKLTAGFGLGYFFKNKGYGFSSGISIGNGQPSYYFAFKAKIF
jgi:hypothetical protein